MSGPLPFTLLWGLCGGLLSDPYFTEGGTEGGGRVEQQGLAGKPGQQVLSSGRCVVPTVQMGTMRPREEWPPPNHPSLSLMPFVHRRCWGRGMGRPFAATQCRKWMCSSQSMLHGSDRGHRASSSRSHFLLVVVLLCHDCLPSPVTTLLLASNNPGGSPYSSGGHKSEVGPAGCVWGTPAGLPCSV
jgi:hypothetical protein